MRRDPVDLRPSRLTQLRLYYEANPDEELTYAAIMIKFECSLRRARKMVYALAEEGVLESVHVIRLREKGMAKEEESHL